jgi:hypothetical protein
LFVKGDAWPEGKPERDHGCIITPSTANWS